MKKTTLLFILTLCCVAMQAATWFVKPSAESTAWADKDAAQVKADLLETFTAAAANDEIWLSAGIHYYTGASATSIAKHIKFYGGFAGTESNIAERMQAEGAAKWNYSNTTIIEPKAGYIGALFTVPSGQNILINGIKFQNFKNLVFGIRNNTTIEACMFYNNISPTTDGAAVTIYPGGNITNCYFLKNSSKSGSAIFVNIKNQNARISGCLFEENTTTNGTNGGAAINVKNSDGHDVGFTATIVDCVFLNNVCNLGSYPSIVLIKTPSASINNCIISNNTGRALDIFAGKASNLTIVNNIGTNGEGAVYMSNNPATTDGAAIYNSVIWGNKRSATDETAQGVVVKAGDKAIISNMASDATNTLAAPATEALVYLLSADNDGGADGVFYPRFVTPTSFAGAGTDETTLAAAHSAYYSITSTSALIDKGNNAYIDGSINFDISGNERFQGASIDLGAFEVKASGSGVEQNKMENIKVFTNQNMISVEAPAGVLSIYSMTGEAISSTRIESESVTISMRKGIYLLVLTADNGNQYTDKIIMQ